MNLDLLVCGLVLFFALLGALAGALMQVSHWAGLIVAGFASKPIGLYLGPPAAQRYAAPELVGIIGVTVVAFFAIYLIVQIALRMVIKRVTKNRVFGGADRILGFGLGGGKAGAFIYVLLSALIFFEKPISSTFHYTFDTRGSKVADVVRAHNLFTTFSFPGLKGLTGLARVAQNPAAAAELANDPEVMALGKDPRVMQLIQSGALQSGDPMAMLRNNNVLSVLTDSKLQDSLAHVGEKLGDLPDPAARKKR